MRVAKNGFGQDFLVSAQLRLGIQAAAGVIQVNLAEPLKTAIVPLAQLVEIVGFVISRVFLDKFSVFVHAEAFLGILRSLSQCRCWRGRRPGWPGNNIFPG